MDRSPAQAVHLEAPSLLASAGKCRGDPGPLGPSRHLAATNLTRRQCSAPAPNINGVFYVPFARHKRAEPGMDAVARRPSALAEKSRVGGTWHDLAEQTEHAEKQGI